MKQIPELIYALGLKGQERIDACIALFALSVTYDNIVPMAAAELGLLPALITVINEDKSEARARACGVLVNLASSAENKVSMASKRLGLISSLINVIKEDKEKRSGVGYCFTTR